MQPRKQPPQILVIDDSDAIAFAVQRAVPECTVRHAPDGVIGLDVLRATPHAIDLIILDLVMPRMDGPTTCMLIRQCAPNVPILPFTGLPSAAAMAPLHELSCLPPLLKPVDPALLAATIRAALGTTPPPLAPGQGVLSWAQEQAARQEYVGRTTPTLHVIVCATTGVVQRGLQDLLEHTGARVVARTPFPKNVPYLLETTAGVAALVTTQAELPALLATLRDHPVPVMCVVATLAGGLAAVQCASESRHPLGVAVEHPDERTTTIHVEHVLRTVAGGAPLIPASLREPFAGLGLTPQEAEFLAAEVQSQPAPLLAERLGIDQATLRQRRKRLRQKLDIPAEQTLAEWTEAWWVAHRLA